MTNCSCCDKEIDGSWTMKFKIKGYYQEDLKLCEDCFRKIRVTYIKRKIQKGKK